MRILSDLAIWASPIAHLSVAILSLHFALHFQFRMLRYVFFLCYLYFALLSFLASTRFPVAFLASLWAQSMALNMLHVLSILFIEELPSPGILKSEFLSLRGLCSTYRLWANPQLLPGGKKASGRESDHEVERPVFLLLRFAKLVIYYYLHARVLPVLYHETLQRILPSDVAQPDLLTRRAWDITPRETVIRAYLAVSWVWDSLAFLDGANSALALFFVGTGFDQPEDWPQLFGSLGEARGLRNFWSRFWHKLALRPYRNCALVVSKTFIRMPRWNSLERQVSDFVVAFVVFLLSGLTHAAVSWRLGMRDWLDLKWFLLNFTACFVEKLVLSMIRNFVAKHGLERGLKTIERSWLGSLIAYGWVFVFLFWSVPLWVYPRYQLAFEKAAQRPQI